METEVLALNQKLFDHNYHDPIDPFALFDKWLKLASEKEEMANAMSLATVDANGLPDIRIVLLKDRTDEGFTFYTNKTSVKGDELSANPKAALGFFWKTLNWQVRIRGAVSDVADQAADDYFNSRPLGSRVGAHASQQSRPLEKRQDLMDLVAKYENEFGEDVPRPDHWSGYVVNPTQIEFWCDGEYRLHDRVRFTRDTPNESWTRQRLFP